MNEQNESVAAEVTNKRPTDPAVQKILAAHGELEAGDIIEYATIEAATMEPRDTNHSRSVITKWKKHLFAENIVLRCVPNVGYTVTDTTGRVMEASKMEGQALRRLRRGLSIINRSNRSEMSGEECAYGDHYQRNYGSLLLYQAVKPQQLDFPKGE